LEYKKKGVELFNVMIDNIQKDVVRNFLNCRVQIGPLPTQMQQSEEVNDSEKTTNVEETE
jgi:preprotein translocase subunit SecA